MKSNKIVLGVLTALMMSSMVIAEEKMMADSNKEMKKGKEPTQEVVWPADKIEYKEVIPGVTQAVLWGNTSKGMYGALTKFAPGTQHALHVHSNDLHMVVISGTWEYGTEKGVSKLGAGSYLVIPGGTKHTSGSSEGCLFFQRGSGKFDMKMMDGTKMEMKKSEAMTGKKEATAMYQCSHCKKTSDKAGECCGMKMNKL